MREKISGDVIGASTIKLLVLALSSLACVAATAGAQPPSRGGAQKSQVVAAGYSCPMHPEVTSDKPGTCPKCSMTLRQAQPSAATRPPAPAAAGQGAGENGSTAPRIPDAEVLDQDGRRVRFYTDLVRGKIVVVQFVFTTCTTICPPLGATFARVQKELGERAGRDVHFISISVDPATDTPERLKAWGAKFHAGPGWTFVTGAKPEIDKLLAAFGVATADKNDHTPTIIIYNDTTRAATRTYGLAGPTQIIKSIDETAAAK
jgi:protein SCO1/2